MKNLEKELFDKWKNSNEKFITDGLIDEETYLNTQTKVVFILKEVNGGENWDLRSFLKEGARPQTWDNIALWQYGIQNIDKIHKWSDLKSMRNDNFRKDQLESIVALNLKKEAGGHTADSKQIWAYAKIDENKQNLRTQIKIYNADIIVCCGTPIADIVKSYQLVEKFEKWKVSTFGIKYYITNSNVIIVNYCHPEARIEDNFKYFPLINTIKEIKNVG